MARVCTICGHPERVAIDKALVAGEPCRQVAALYRVPPDAMERHFAAHLSQTVARAQEAHALDVMEELTRCFRRVNLLFDACDRWLRDPEDESRYTLEPRTDDVQVIYTEPGPGGRPVRKKAPLSRLLAQLEEAGIDVQRGEYKVADPRKLVLDAAATLKSQTELLAKLLGELQQEGTVNLVVSPEWTALRTGLLQALAPYPEARVAVADHLVALEADAAPTAGRNGHGR